LNLGVSLEAKGDRTGAEAAYRQALLLQPDLTRAREYLARISKN
jgi:Flp pilus assembly protein TadD